MQISVKEVTGSRELIFPALPEEIKFNMQTRFVSYDIMDLGEVKGPHGKELCGVSWSGRLPGTARGAQPWIVSGSTRNPEKCRSILDAWRREGKKLRLMITGTSINIDVFLEKAEFNYAEGFGDIEYTVSWVEAKEVIISSRAGAAPSTARATARPEPEQSKTYTVKKGDCLWHIAKALYGNGSDYRTIYNANKDIIKNPNLIYPGQVLKIP